MKKGSKSQRIRRKLVKAQHQLRLTQESRTEAIAKGEAEIAAARTKAAARVVKRTEQVEHWSDRIADLERRLGELRQEARDRTETPSRHASPVSTQASTPDTLHAELSFLESRLTADRETRELGPPALELEPMNHPSEAPVEGPSGA